MNGRAALLLALILLSGRAPSAQAADLTGRVTQVIDGDSLIMETAHGSRLELRLAGIDAPELDQPYGARAAAQLRSRILHQRIDVELQGADRYGRLLGCPLHDGENLCHALVARGQAWAYARSEAGQTHEAAQAAAQRKRLGLWRATADPLSPWRWRVRQRAAANPGGCPIKGNISRTGARIYHVPGQQDYTRTRISVRRGERWFCSKSEAEAAGWRPAAR